MNAQAGLVRFVDDDEAVRSAVGSLMRSAGFDVQLYASAQDFLDAPPADAPCCAILDVRLPGLNGLECQRRLAARNDTVPVIFLTGHGDIAMSVRAMKSGAFEFLTKPFQDTELIDAVKLALERDRQERRVRGETDALRARLDSLTPREREVMAWVITGMPNRQIAQALGTSEITVKVHRGNMMRKMAATSVPSLLRMADALGVKARKARGR
jgi:FixJ family two-component response regulator